MLINNQEICFKLDTGTEANILPLSILIGKKLCELCELNKIEIMLASYNHRLKPEGCLDLLCFTENFNDVLLKLVIVNVESKRFSGWFGL